MGALRPRRERHQQSRHQGGVGERAELGNYKKYVRLKVPWGGYMYPAYTINQAFTECDVYASLAKLKNHWIAGVTMSMKNNFGNTPCSLYGGDCGPSGNERPTKERGDVLHAGTTKAPSGVDAELHPDSPRDPGYRVPRIRGGSDRHSAHRSRHRGRRGNRARRRRSLAERIGTYDARA